MPVFNPILVDSGLVFRTADPAQDRFFADSLYYGSTPQPLRYYIAPAANYSFANGANFVAFDSMYAGRLKRESNLEAAIALQTIPHPNDQRPNELASLQSTIGSQLGDLHIKDYHIYIWAQLEQIDQKLAGCAVKTDLVSSNPEPSPFILYPNPNSGRVRVRLTDALSLEPGERIEVLDVMGREVTSVEVEGTEVEIQLNEPGIYCIRTRWGAEWVVVR